MTDIKSRLKILRGSRTQDEFSMIIGVHRNTLARWEAGKGEPDFSVLNMIAQKMRISPEWLLMGTGPMYRDEQVGKTGDASPVLEEKKCQLVDIVDSEKNKTGDASPVSRLQLELMKSFQKMMELQERLMISTEQNADLRIQLERKDSRIRELEREAAEVPALKARIAELESKLAESPKQPKVVQVDVSAKSKPTPAHGAGTDTAVVPGTGAGISGVGNLGAVVKNGE